jgi:hypothetical protein
MLALTPATCLGDDGAPAPPPGAPSVMDMARALGRDVVTHMARGYVPGRSGEILLAPKPWNVLGQWNNGLRGANDPRTTHASPWAYHQRVPIVLFGPGHVRAGVQSQRPVDVADLAPTFADLLGFDFDAPDGQSLTEALEPPGRQSPPRVVVLVAYDGGGWNVLEQWPDAWPVLRALAGNGTTYLNATVGSSPSLTAPVHATMGTGGYPRYHGLPENTARRPDGEISEVYYKRADPVLLRGPTVADGWDAANGNRAWVGLLGFESWHLGMMGKGARGAVGDRDLAILWEREEFDFRTNEDAYRDLPAYLPEATALGPFLDQLDARDGARDDRWQGNDLFRWDTFILPGTPAFVDFQSAVLQRLLRREPVGRDGLTDFLFVEMKTTDYGGHIWNMLRPEMGEIVEAQDRMVGDLVGSLDEIVGPGRWVLALTADHGQTPLPSRTGGLRIDRVQLEGDIEAYFGADIVEALHPSELYLTKEEMDVAGISLEDVARYVGDYRYGDGLPDGTDVASIPPDLLDRRVFAGALPGSFVRSLTPAGMAALGPGEYPQGDLTSPTDYGALLSG